MQVLAITNKEAFALLSKLQNPQKVLSSIILVKKYIDDFQTHFSEVECLQVMYDIVQ